MESLGGTITVIIVIILSVSLMVVFPLMTTADRADDVTQQILDTETSELVNEMCTKGILTQARYDEFLQAINSTGYSYDVQIIVKVLDENAAKKTAQVTHDKIGENEYYDEYTTQNLEKLDSNGEIRLSEGCFVYVYVINPNSTIASQLKKIFFNSSDADINSAVSSASGMVTTTAK